MNMESISEFQSLVYSVSNVDLMLQELLTISDQFVETPSELWTDLAISAAMD